MKTVINTYFSEDSISNLYAEVWKTDAGVYGIDYVRYGDVVKTESFPGKTQQFVENKADLWAREFRVLHG